VREPQVARRLNQSGVLVAAERAATEFDGAGAREVLELLRRAETDPGELPNDPVGDARLRGAVTFLGALRSIAASSMFAEVPPSAEKPAVPSSAKLIIGRLRFGLGDRSGYNPGAIRLGGEQVGRPDHFSGWSRRPSLVP
jgi:hypothetical protein